MRRDILLKAHENIAFRPFAEKAAGSRLGFRLADGRMKSLPYMQLVETEFNPDLGGIVLEYVGHRVTLIGRNLRQLYFEIEAEAVGEIIERHGPDIGLPEDACFVREILWERM